MIEKNTKIQELELNEIGLDSQEKEMQLFNVLGEKITIRILYLSSYNHLDHKVIWTIFLWRTKQKDDVIRDDEYEIQIDKYYKIF